MSEDDWTMTSEPASSLHIGPCERCAALVAERDRLRDAFKRSDETDEQFDARVERLVHLRWDYENALVPDD